MKALKDLLLSGTQPFARAARFSQTEKDAAKPMDLAGTDYDRIGIAGLGVAIAGQALLKESNTPIKCAPYAVQGVGAMGSALQPIFTK